MLIEETHVNKDEKYWFGRSLYEIDGSSGEIFREMRQKHGRCVSKVYIDDKEDGSPIQVGWVFEKKMQYDDSKEKYMQETWVVLYDKPPTITKHYHRLD